METTITIGKIIHAKRSLTQRRYQIIMEDIDIKNDVVEDLKERINLDTEFPNATQALKELKRNADAARATNEEITKVYKKIQSTNKRVQSFLKKDLSEVYDKLSSSEYWSAAESRVISYLSAFKMKELRENEDIFLNEFHLLLDKYGDDVIDEMLADVAEIKEVDDIYKSFICLLMSFDYEMRHREDAVSQGNEYKLHNEYSPWQFFDEMDDEAELTDPKLNLTLFGQEEEEKKTALNIFDVYPIDRFSWFTDRISNVMVEKFNEAAKGDGYFEIKSKGVDDRMLVNIEVDGGLSFETVLNQLNLDNILTYYDKLIFMIVCSLYEAGNEYITASAIYRTIYGQDTTGDTATLKKIEESIEKMSLIKISINNEEEVAAYPSYKKLNVDSRYFLAAEKHKETIYIKNMPSKCTFHILTRPPLADIAVVRGNKIQIALKSIFDAGIKITEQNMIIINYLVQRISMARSQNKSDINCGVIKLDTLFEKCNLTTRSQKSRAVVKIDKMLNAFKKDKLIDVAVKDNNCFLITESAVTNKGTNKPTKRPSKLNNYKKTSFKKK